MLARETFVRSVPVQELSNIESKTVTTSDLTISQDFNLAEKTGQIKTPCMLTLTLEAAHNFSLVLSNDANQKLVIGYDQKLNQYFIDRIAAGKSGFQKEFAGRHVAPRLTDQQPMSLSILLDESSARTVCR